MPGCCRTARSRFWAGSTNRSRFAAIASSRAKSSPGSIVIRASKRAPWSPATSDAGPTLVAYIVAARDAKLTATDLREFLAARLPDYMIPAQFVTVAELPLNAQRKTRQSGSSRALGRRICCRTVRRRRRDRHDGAASQWKSRQRQVAKQIAALVASLLGQPSVAADDNFFMIGGHSMLGVQLVARIRDLFGVKLTLRQLFSAPTVAALSARSRAADRGAAMADTASEVPLSLYHLLEPGGAGRSVSALSPAADGIPVHWDPYLHAWIVTRYDDVITVLTRFSAERAPSPEYFEALGAPEVSPIAKVMVKQMLFRDAPAHTRLRKLAGGAFVPARVRVLARPYPGNRHAADRRHPGPRHGRMDLLADFAEPLPAIVTAEMLGVPVEDHVRLKNWSATFAEMLGNFQHNPDRLPAVLEAVEGLTAYFQDAIDEQRKHPRDGLIHALMTSEVDGDRLTDEEVIANCIVTMVGGLETTTNLIGNGMLSLLRNPEQMARLRAEPATHAGRGRGTAALRKPQPAHRAAGARRRRCSAASRSASARR